MTFCTELSAVGVKYMDENVNDYNRPPEVYEEEAWEGYLVDHGIKELAKLSQAWAIKVETAIDEMESAARIAVLAKAQAKMVSKYLVPMSKDREDRLEQNWVRDFPGSAPCSAYMQMRIRLEHRLPFIKNECNCSRCIDARKNEIEAQSLEYAK